MTRDTSGFSDRVYMAKLEELLGRKRTTIRKWERDGLLPDELMPHRDEIDWRYWTREQAEGLKQFAAALESRQGFKPKPAAA
jgi:hypothetical protein